MAQTTISHPDSQWLVNREPDQKARRRERCLSCFRPRAHCYCGWLPRIDNRTSVVIVQHPRERFHPFGTARLAELCLERVQIVVNHNGELNDCTDLGLSRDAALLYPSPAARPLESLSPEERPSQLVLLDGTWHHARTLFRDIPAIRRLPRLSFTPSAPSRYRIRKEPREHFVSTIEALVHALGHLEPDTTNLEGLLTAFERIIDAQLEHQGSVVNGGRQKRLRRRASRHIPECLVEGRERLVIAYGESQRALSGQPRRTRLPVYFTALKPHTGELFRSPVQPEVPLSPLQLAHMGLSDEDFAGALTVRQFRDRWLDFIEDDDIVVAYNKSTLDMLTATNALPRHWEVLKSAYFNLKRGGGSLDTIVDREGLEPHSLQVPGRSAERLANAVALCEWLCAIGCQL